LQGYIFAEKHGVNSKNIIYYNHSQSFGVGWMNELSPEEKAEITKKFKNFPYKWEFNKK